MFSHFCSSAIQTLIYFGLFLSMVEDVAREEFKKMTAAIVEDQMYVAASDCLIRDAVHRGRPTAQELHSSDAATAFYAGLQDVIVSDFEKHQGLADSVLVGVPSALVAPTPEERLSSSLTLFARTPAVSVIIRKACPTFMAASDQIQADIIKGYVAAHQKAKNSKPSSSSMFLQGLVFVLFQSFNSLCCSS